MADEAMSRPAECVVAFYNKRGTCEQWIKEGKGAIKWTRLSCRTFAAKPHLTHVRFAPKATVGHQDANRGSWPISSRTARCSDAKVDAWSDRSNPASRHFAWGKLWQPRDGAGLAR
jgi:hypothetical protein